MGNGSGKHRVKKTKENDGSAEGSKVDFPSHGFQANNIDVKPKQDVMISYSHQDIQVMRTIQDMIKEAGLSAWVDESSLTPGAAYLRKIGEAIVDSACFLTILSFDSIASKYCRDEVSLAYISNKTIFAIALQSYDELSEKMDLGMKLTLACVQWHVIDTTKDISPQLQPLLESIAVAIKSDGDTDGENSDVQASASEDEETNEQSYVMNRQAYRFRRQKTRDVIEPNTDIVASGSNKDFWKTFFGDEIQVPWKKIEELITQEYDSMFKDLEVDEDDKAIIFRKIKKEMQTSAKGLVSYRAYKMFTTRDKTVIPFPDAIKLFATESFAMQEVFAVSSSVRLSAIQNLGKFQSNAVIDALLDLLDEDDPNVRVVAAISLAHAASGVRMFKRRAQTALLECLNNNDRLVRESGCLALGRIKSKQAINKLVQLWRNDTISSVRDAAQVAIGQIGGEEAEQALHVTKILSDEIQLLKS